MSALFSPIQIDQWCVFEQSGQIVHAKVVSVSDKNIRLNNNKRIARQQVWFNFDESMLNATIQTADIWRGQLDIDELWQASAGENLTLAELTAVGTNDTHVGIQWAVLECIIANPIYFKRFNQQIIPVNASVLQKALTSVDARKRLLHLENQLLTELQANKVPDAIAQDMIPLLCQTNKLLPTYQALRKFLGKDKEAFAQFFINAGLLKDICEYWIILFESQWNHADTNDNVVFATTDLPNLPKSETMAFSIDDGGTIEVDDAFSVNYIDDELVQIGVHIAAPALINNDKVFEIARHHLTSVYTPTKKYPMLPLSIIEEFSLSTTHFRPAISLYILFNPSDNSWQVQNTTVELIKLNSTLTPDQVSEGKISDAVQKAYDYLFQFSDVLIFQKPLPYVDRSRNFKVDTANMLVSKRDKNEVHIVVETLMRLVNSHWGKQINQANIGGLYRHNGNTIALSKKIEDPYVWVSSPLRRFVDLINQRLLLSLLSYPKPYSEQWHKLAKQYEIKRAQARHFQMTMECHWAMMILQQKTLPFVEPIDISKRGKIQLKNYPITVQTSSPLPINVQLSQLKSTQLQITSINFFTQQVIGDLV